MGDKYVYVSSHGPGIYGPLWHVSINLQSRDFSEADPHVPDLDFYIQGETIDIETASALGWAMKKGLDA
jgi:hypothetical protein